MDHVYTENTKRKPVDLPNQDIETSDRVAMKVSGTITFLVKHVDKIWMENQDHEDALIVFAMTTIARWINLHTYAECSCSNIESAVFPELRRLGFKWGCEVETLGITHLAKQRVYSVTTG